MLHTPITTDAAAPLGADRAGDYAHIRRAIAFLSATWTEQPSLERLAVHLGLSPAHCQKLFKRWCGLSPKEFVQAITVDHARGLLQGSSSVFDTALEVGLSGGGRLHDLFVSHEAMTPGDYKRRGEGLDMAYGFHASPFGEALLIATDRGLAGLASLLLFLCVLLHELSHSLVALTKGLKVPRITLFIFGGVSHLSDEPRRPFDEVLLAIAGGMALLLGIVGIYGVLAYAVMQRRREVGIRLALGAPSGSVKRLFVYRGMLLSGVGIAIGAAVAAGITRWMSSLLFGVTPVDAVTFGAAATVLALAALAASYLPAHRAAAVDPVETLSGQ